MARLFGLALLVWLSTLASVPRAARCDLRTFDRFAFNRMRLEKKIVVLDFHSKNCPICRSRSPILEKVLGEKKFSEIIGMLVDYGAETEIRRRYDVSSEMTVLVLYEGKEVERVAGQIRHEALKGAIEAAIEKVQASRQSGAGSGR